MWTKKKYGLNLQAVCDAERRFLSLSILYGASASDLLSFEASDLRIILQREGYLANGLCLFGDNAYVNRSFMATPYPNAAGDIEKDAYNFFHSQVRINIECAFGVLVNRWGFLRKKAPRDYSIKKTISVVSCLCRLHNFLIDQKEGNPPDQHIPEDELTLAVGGAVDAPSRPEGGIAAPANRLVGGGEHFDDDPDYVVRRRISRENRLVTEQYENQLPRECMFISMVNKNLRRPARNLARNANRQSH